MKPTDFAYYLTDFLAKYLPGTVDLVPIHIMFIPGHLSLFLEITVPEQKKIKPEKVSLVTWTGKLIEDIWSGLRKPATALYPPETCAWSAALHSFCRYCNSNFRIAFTRRSRYWRFR